MTSLVTALKALQTLGSAPLNNRFLTTSPWFNWVAKIRNEPSGITFVFNSLSFEISPLEPFESPENKKIGQFFKSQNFN